ncbi:MAG: acylphosphatase, partial [Thermodesulfovibrionia bacterium]|nr:acylphosphatase [Thermodesulfovibrionia bacterium]
MEKGRVHLYITGFVQGVFFRASTRDMAVKLGL